jgi:glyoxylase-like metal-dependent hydrolase (beta-lactamase superfamily II)
MKITLDEKEAIAAGVWGSKDVFVNYYFIQDAETKAWFLVDAGMKWSTARIKRMAKNIFGENSKPAGIILTHGHFDHVGALKSLLKEWNVPVYAHQLEVPYLTGQSAYPPADTTVGGGMMTTMSWMYPTGAIDIGQYLHIIPSNNKIPGLSEWTVIDTPGHSPGHISLFREQDKVLIAGDAIVTTQQESAIHAVTYKEKLSGPPKYLTCNWASAKFSAIKIAGLDPSLLAAGHGQPMEGERLKQALTELIAEFDTVAVPHRGRYVNEPAVANSHGVVYVPPAVTRVPAMVKVLGMATALIALGLISYWQVRKKRLHRYQLVK